MLTLITMVKMFFMSIIIAFMALKFINYTRAAVPKEQTCDADGVCVDTIPKGATLDGKPREAEKICEDRTSRCKQYAAQGECEKNPGWMIMFCGASCNACEMRDPKIRCDRERLNISTTPIYAPGDMQSMFSSIEGRFGDRYGINILSTEPWVVTLDNFVSDAEIDALISTNINSLERSTDTGSMNEFGETGKIVSKVS